MTDTITHLGYTHGDRVRDTRDGSTGHVRFLVHTEEELRAAETEGTAIAEVRWDNSFVADQLEVALPHLERL